MIKWLKNKWFRHQYRKAIENAFQLARHLYPDISQEKRKELRRALNDLLDEYHFNWGAEDGVVKFYYDRLKDFEVIYHHK